MKPLPGLLVLLLLASLLFVRPVSAIGLGQVDDFENGAVLGWANGVPGHLLNINTGGPAGVGDNYLQLISDGVGQGGRLTMFNLQQWLGNYIAQGVNRIELDLINQGPTNLSLRLAFKSQNQPNVPGYLSPAMLLAPGSGWQHFSIAITAANLIAIGNPPPAAFNSFFTTGPGDVRLINEVGAADLNGDFIVAQVGIDNIRAVPEPTTIALVLGAALALVCRPARWRRLGR
ncbi:MAG TPA: hypothetical protein VK474_04540 [Chthoniobacterales bacterium]|nr:hypothetical protein [Chthoniobacterales bacterium]